VVLFALSDCQVAQQAVLLLHMLFCCSTRYCALINPTSWMTAFLSLNSHFLGSLDSTLPLKATSMGSKRSSFLASTHNSSDPTAYVEVTP
jgi:hypothetical protein